MALSRAEKRRVRRRRVRRKILGTQARPRLCVYKSLKHIYVQIIDDSQGKTLVAASTMSPELKDKLKNTRSVEAAREVGKMAAEKSKAVGISEVVFDRNGFLYHGKIKALAEAAREVGLQF